MSYLYSFTDLLCGFTESLSFCKYILAPISVLRRAKGKEITRGPLLTQKKKWGDGERNCLRGGREASSDQDVSKENKKINEEKGIKELKSKLIPLLVYSTYLYMRDFPSLFMCLLMWLSMHLLCRRRCCSWIISLNKTYGEIFGGH